MHVLWNTIPVIRFWWGWICTLYPWILTHSVIHFNFVPLNLLKFINQKYEEALNIVNTDTCSMNITHPPPPTPRSPSSFLILFIWLLVGDYKSLKNDKSVKSNQKLYVDDRHTFSKNYLFPTPTPQPLKKEKGKRSIIWSACDNKTASSLTNGFIDCPITVTTVIKNHLFGGGPIVDWQVSQVHL